MKTLDRSISEMPDGTYRVVTQQMCAGFVIESGKMTRCAPILRKRFERGWKVIAHRIEDVVPILYCRKCDGVWEKHEPTCADCTP